MSSTLQDLSNDTTFSKIKSRVPVPLSRRFFTLVAAGRGHPVLGWDPAEGLWAAGQRALPDCLHAAQHFHPVQAGQKVGAHCIC